MVWKGVSGKGAAEKLGQMMASLHFIQQTQRVHPEPGVELGSGDTTMRRQRLESRWVAMNLKKATGLCHQGGTVSFS